nr:hypothetical protein [Parachlamydiaceae bacterium]
MNNLKDVFPSLCLKQQLASLNTDELFSGLRAVAAWSGTCKSIKCIVSSNDFWHNLVTRIGCEALYLEKIPKYIDENWLDFLKHHIRLIPLIETRLLSFNFFSPKTVKRQSEFDIICPEPYGLGIYTPKDNHFSKLKLPIEEDSPYLDPDSINVASSEDYIAIDRGNGDVLIFSVKNGEYLKKIDPNLILVIQLEIRDNFLYVVGK